MFWTPTNALYRGCGVHVFCYPLQVVKQYRLGSYLGLLSLIWVYTIHLGHQPDGFHSRIDIVILIICLIVQFVCSVYMMFNVKLV